MAGITTSVQAVPHTIPTGITPIVINLDTTGTIALLAGPAGQIIDVWGLALSCNGANSVQFLSGSTQIGTFVLAAGSNIYIPVPKGFIGARAIPLMSTQAAGDNLSITCTNTVVTGGIVYVSTRLAGVN